MLVYIPRSKIGGQSVCIFNFFIFTAKLLYSKESYINSTEHGSVFKIGIAIFM